MYRLFGSSSSDLRTSAFPKALPSAQARWPADIGDAWVLQGEVHLASRTVAILCRHAVVSLACYGDVVGAGGGKAGVMTKFKKGITGFMSGMKQELLADRPDDAP